MNDVDATIYGCTSASEVERAFAQVLPSGSTPTNVRLDDLMRPYIEVRGYTGARLTRQDCEDAKAKRTKMPKPTIFVCIVRLHGTTSLTSPDRWRAGRSARRNRCDRRNGFAVRRA